VSPAVGMVAGVDGCRAGWVVVEVAARARGAGDGPSATARVVDHIGEVAAAIEAGQLLAAAVDIPIGLTVAGPRACDREARRLLGPRRSSVFPAPVRAVLGATSYAEACALSREVCGKSVSMQLYNIVAKIREVDRVVSPRLQQRLFEACPELSLRVLAGNTPMRHHKRTAEGRAERIAALGTTGLADVEALVEARPTGARRDDLLDALALAWTARRHVAGACVHLGGEADERGLRMEIAA